MNTIGLECLECRSLDAIALWSSPAVLGLIAVFMVGAVVFFRAETHGGNPFVDLRLFSNKT